MIIDIHGHLGNINFAPFWQADAKTLEDYCDQSGVDLLCISASRSIMYDVHEGNIELDKALKETEKLLGYVVYNPISVKSSVKGYGSRDMHSFFIDIHIYKTRSLNRL